MRKSSILSHLSGSLSYCSRVLSQLEVPGALEPRGLSQPQEPLKPQEPRHSTMVQPPARMLRAEMIRFEHGLEGDVLLAPFDPASLNLANLQIPLEVLEALNLRPPNLFGLKGDPHLTLSWLVVGAVPTTQGRLHHPEASTWCLGPRMLEALASEELPSPAGLANGLARLIRDCVHPQYGQAGWVSGAFFSGKPYP